MTIRYAGPEPDGICVYCGNTIPPDWDTSGKVKSKWFCSAPCIARDWLQWAQVPSAYCDFDRSLPSCGPDRIRIAEGWIDSQKEMEGDRPGLLLHSVRSGTGKTRVAIHLATLHMLVRWRGWKVEDYELTQRNLYSTCVWLNARRFRQKYQETMHFSKAAQRTAWVDDLCGCDLLVLDEPDKLKPSEGLVEIIYSILDERFTEGSLTILTTNAGGRELEQRWGQEYGPYLVRRIREFCLAINFDP